MVHSGKKSWAPGVLLLISCVCISSVFSADLVQLSNGAVCNDGSPASFYFQKSVTNSTKWLIQLEEKGFCWDNNSCSTRSSELTSSAGYAASITLNDWMSNNQTINPLFYDFNFVLVKYCSSDVYVGDHLASSPSAWNFTFAGSFILPALFQALKVDHGFNDSTELLVSGGLGVLLNLPRISQMVGSPFRAIIDSGWYVNGSSYQSVSLDSIFQTAYTVWNASLNDSCKALPQPHACFFGPKAYTLRPTGASVLILQFQNDKQTTELAFNIQGANSNAFNSAERQFLKTWASEVAASFSGISAVISPNCVSSSLFSAFNNIAVLNSTVSSLITSWYTGVSVSAVDCCTEVFCNPTCGQNCSCSYTCPTPPTSTPVSTGTTAAPGTTAITATGTTAPTATGTTATDAPSSTIDISSTSTTDPNITSTTDVGGNGTFVLSPTATARSNATAEPGKGEDVLFSVAGFDVDIIIGASIGGAVVLVIIVLVAALIICKCKKKGRGKRRNYHDDIYY